MAELNYKQSDTIEQHNKYILKPNAVVWVCCICNAKFNRRLTGAQYKRKDRVYCSLECSWQSKRGKKLKVTQARQNAIDNKIATKHNKALIRALLSALKKIRAIKARQEKLHNNSTHKCKVCNSLVGYKFGRARLYCSEKCSKKFNKIDAERLEIARTNRRIAKAKRKALERSVEYEKFNPLDVLERDGWKCQLCGISTPKSLRGKDHKRAPELDHIIPISKGGSHTKLNTQCLCKSCNGWKSNKHIVGQIRLFNNV